MSEPLVKESRLPELRLPEISRDDIVRTFAEIKRPDIDLKAVEWPKVDLSRVEVTRDDIDKAILGVTTAARLARPAVRSSRLPLAIGFVIVAGLAIFAILSRPAVRERLAQTAQEARQRVEAARSRAETLEVEADITGGSGHTSPVAIPIVADAFTEATETVTEAATEATETVKSSVKAASKSA